MQLFYGLSGSAGLFKAVLVIQTVPGIEVEVIGSQKLQLLLYCRPHLGSFGDCPLGHQVKAVPLEIEFLECKAEGTFAPAISCRCFYKVNSRSQSPFNRIDRLGKGVIGDGIFRFLPIMYKAHSSEGNDAYLFFCFSKAAVCHWRFIILNHRPS